MIENLFWEKYRPKTIEDMVLLPRIKKLVDNGIQTNLILYGNYGTGKTSLAKILCKGHPNLKLNASIDTSIDILRTKINDFCSKMSMFDTDSDIKIVFMDEVDRISNEFQDGMKAFIEDYKDSVRFIYTTNHIERITDGNLSRLTKVNFDPINLDEVKFLKSAYASKLFDICNKESIELEKGDIVNIVNQNFPDMRSMIQVLQEIKITGTNKTTTIDTDKSVDKLIEIAITKVDTVEIFHFIMSEFGQDNIDHMVKLCGRPLIEKIAKINSKYIPLLPDILEKVTFYTEMLNNKYQDPILVGSTLMTQIQKICNIK